MSVNFLSENRTMIHQNKTFILFYFFEKKITYDVSAIISPGGFLYPTHAIKALFWF